VSFRPRLGLPATALTIVFHYDLAGNLLAETSGSGTPIRTYVWREAASGPLAETLLDHPVAQIEHANNAALCGSNGTAVEAVLYLRTDELATPREARNAAGTVVWSWTSAAFGDTTAAEDPDGNGQRTIVNLRFPGQYADQEAGLHYNWHRSYDPATGRYLESDPVGLGGGPNTYLYVYALPLRLVDRTGLMGQGSGLRGPTYPGRPPGATPEQRSPAASCQGEWANQGSEPMLPAVLRLCICYWLCMGLSVCGRLVGEHQGSTVDYRNALL
jgi:RHS repeat-associated protein